MKNIEEMIVSLSILILAGKVLICATVPVNSNRIIRPRQLGITRTNDGGYQATFSLAQAFKNPGIEGTIAATRVYNIGRQGSSSAGGQSANFMSETPGLLFDYSMSNSEAQARNPYGTAEADANAMAKMVKTPWSSSSNTKANTFANVNRFNNPTNIGYF